MDNNEIILDVKLNTASVKADAAAIALTFLGVKKSVQTMAEVLSGAFAVKGYSGYLTAVKKFGKDLGDELLGLQFRFGKLKAAIINAAEPVARVFVPLLNQGLLAMARFLNGLGKVLTALLGGADGYGSMAESSNEAADAQVVLAKATTASGKAAKRSLAAFDELNRLTSSTGGGGSASGQVSSLLPERVNDTLSPQLQAIVDRVRQIIEPLRAIDFTGAVMAFGQLKAALTPFVQSLFAGLKWAYDSLFVPLVRWTSENLLPAFLNLLSNGVRVLSSVLTAFKPMGQWLWDSFLKPIAQWTGGIIVDVLKWLGQELQRIGNWVNENSPAVKSFFQTLSQWTGGVVTNVLQWIGQRLQGIGSWVKENSSAVRTFLLTLAQWTGGMIVNVLQWLGQGLQGIANCVKENGPAIKAFFQNLSQWTGGVITNVLQWLGQSLQGIGNWVKENSTVIKAFFQTLGQWTGGVILSVLQWLNQRLQSIGNWVKENSPAIKSFFQTLGQWAGSTILSALQWLTQKLQNVSSWMKENTSLVKGIVTVVASVAAAIALVNSGLGQWNTLGIKGISAATSLGSSMSMLKTPISLAATAVTGMITAVSQLIKNWDWLKTSASNAWTSIRAVWAGASAWLEKNLLTPMKSGFKNTVNGIIGFVNGMIRGVVSGINAVIRAINKINVTIPHWIPVLGGKRLGFQLQTFTPPTIPYLAQGAVLPANRPFLAVVGDQKQGTNVEAPLATIQEAVASVLAQQPGTETVVNVQFTGELAQLARLLKPVIDTETRRRGGSVIKEAFG